MSQINKKEVYIIEMFMIKYLTKVDDVYEYKWYGNGNKGIILS